MTSEKKIKIFIYVFYFPTSDKYYVGQTCHLKDRMAKHIKSKYPIGCALRKYGNWELKSLHVCSSDKEADRLEIEEICGHNSIAPNGYNLTPGGEGGDTFTNNPNKAEILTNMSRASKGRCPSDETKQRMREAAVGRVMSDDQKEKLRQANLGKKASVETRRKISEAVSGEKNGFYGKPLSSESKAKVFATKRAKTVAKTIGKTFGRLKAVEYLSDIIGNRDWYRCVCICGREENIVGNNLRREAISKCKCELSSDGGYPKMRSAQIKRRYKECKQKIRDLEDEK